MRSIVTGGAGFIGSHLVDALLEAGDEVVVLDDLSSGKPENLSGALQSGAALSEVDVSDSAAVGRAFEDFKPEAVFHLAAQIDVRKSMADPGFDARLNVVGTLNVLEAAARTGVGRFVFTSTGGAIYGEGEGREDELPFAETARCEPFSVYGQSKLAAEGYLDLYRRGRGLSTAALRLGNVYGPRQDPALEAGVVAIFCDLARDGGRPIVFGDSSPREAPRRRARSTSARAPRPACWTWRRPSAAWRAARTSSPVSSRRARARSSARTWTPRRRRRI